MGVERDDGGSKRRGRNLALGHRTDIADTLRQDEIRPEFADAGDIDLIHAAVIPQSGADGGVNLTARQPFEVGSRPRQPRAISDARRVVAAVRDSDETISQTERANDLGSARQQRDDSLSVQPRSVPLPSPLGPEAEIR